MDDQLGLESGPPLCRQRKPEMLPARFNTAQDKVRLARYRVQTFQATRGFVDDPMLDLVADDLAAALDMLEGQ